MKRLATLLIVAMLFIGGCIPSTPSTTATNKVSLSVRYPTGAILAPLPPMMAFRDNQSGKRLLALATPQSGGVLPTNRMPVLYQQGNSCGPCALAAISYPLSHQTFSPAFTYVLSRQYATPANWQADNGSYTYANIHVAQTNGQPRIGVWAYPQGDINAIPSNAAVVDAANYKLVAVATPDLPSVESALAGGSAVGLYISATTDVYYPIALTDGSFEVKTATATSTRIGGHFWTAVWFDNTRKMMDGTTGGILIENSWGTGWAQNGFAWVSTAGWVTSNLNGNLSQSYTILAAPSPAPLNLTISSPATPTITVKAGDVVGFAWTSNADSVTVTESQYNSKTVYQPNGSFINRAGTKTQIFTFTATRASDNGTIAKTITVNVAP